MKRRLSNSFVAAYLREIGIDFVPAPPRGRAAAAGPAPGGTKGESLEDIRKELAGCRGCALCDGRRTIVFGVGNPKARLMFVGEGPGQEEDRQGEPFVGAAGRRLNQWIGRIGLSVTWPITNLNTIVSVFFGAVLFREVPIEKRWPKLVQGMALALIGVLLLGLSKS